MSTQNQYAQLHSQAATVGSTTQKAARFAVVTAITTLILIVILHIIKSDMAPSWHMISEYAIGEHGWVMKLAFFAWSLSCISLVASVRNQVATVGGRVGLFLLFIVGISIIMAGIFVMDSPQTPKDELTVHGNLHGLAATIGIPGQAIAAVLISLSLARNPSWKAAKRSIIWAAHFTWVSLVIKIGRAHV